MEIMAPIKKGGDLHKNGGKIARKGESMTGGHKKDFCPFCCDRRGPHAQIFSPVGFFFQGTGA